MRSELITLAGRRSRLGGTWGEQPRAGARDVEPRALWCPGHSGDYRLTLSTAQHSSRSAQVGLQLSECLCGAAATAADSDGGRVACEDPGKLAGSGVAVQDRA